MNRLPAEMPGAWQEGEAGYTPSCYFCGHSYHNAGRGYHKITKWLQKRLFLLTE
ncbi:hypothetical protein CBFG_02716 [Clostridiales bacterium 1_7_47FAA]|nr:hypothetical protein CBFG_02716 [Clostridiales bacterium 1_7_47FAA]